MAFQNCYWPRVIAAWPKLSERSKQVVAHIVESLAEFAMDDKDVKAVDGLVGLLRPIPERGNDEKGKTAANG